MTLKFNPNTTLNELKSKMKQYMTYYNNYIYQWNLKKMTPIQYRNHLLIAKLFFQCIFDRVL